MEQKNRAELAEQLEKRRYIAMFWQTVSFAVWFGLLIAVFFMKDAGVKPQLWSMIAIGAVSFAGVIVFIVYTFKLSMITRTIVRDPELRSIVNNEMYLANDYKAGTLGYYATLVACIAMVIVADNTNISAIAATMVVLYVAALSAKVAQLIMHR